MFSETRLGTSYFQQMTLRPKIPKIIDTSLQNNWYSALEWSVNYFGNFGAKCHFLKIGCRESSFIKHWDIVIKPEPDINPV